MNMNAKHDELRLLLSRMAPSQEDLDDQHRMPRNLKAMGPGIVWAWVLIWYLKL